MGTEFGIFLAFIIAIFIYKDAEARDMSGLGWAFGVFMLLIVFLPLYLIVRKPRVK